MGRRAPLSRGHFDLKTLPRFQFALKVLQKLLAFGSAPNKLNICAKIEVKFQQFGVPSCLWNKFCTYLTMWFCRLLERDITIDMLDYTSLQSSFSMPKSFAHGGMTKETRQRWQRMCRMCCTFVQKLRQKSFSNQKAIKCHKA